MRLNLELDNGCMTRAILVLEDGSLAKAGLRVGPMPEMQAHRSPRPLARVITTSWTKR